MGTNTDLQTLATQDAIREYLPPPDVQLAANSTVFTPELFAQCAYRYAQGELAEDIAKSYGFPHSLLWRWSTIPGLAPIWANATKDHAKSLMQQATKASKELMKGERTETRSGETRPLTKYEVAALDRGARLLIDIATKQNPEDYSDRLQIDKKQISAVYVVAYDANQSPEAALSVPRPDRVGIEQSALPQKWREKISKESRLKALSAPDPED